MFVTIHRGSHEVGGSCVEVTSGGSRIVIDIGLPLVDKNGNKFSFRQYEALPGPELVEKRILPDIPGFYEWDKDSKRVDALLVSHAHADHYGLWSYVRMDIPRYLGAATHRLIEVLALFTPRKVPVATYRHFEAGEKLSIGDFTVVPFLMDHSAFDAYAFVLGAEGKSVIYSGDFRSGGRKAGALNTFLKGAPKEADALIIEGTNIGRVKEPNKTEKQLEKEIREVFLKAPGVVLGMTSAQNIDRMVSFYKAARSARRTLVLDLYMASVLTAVGELWPTIPYPSKHYTGLRVHYHPRLRERLVKAGRMDLVKRFYPFHTKSEEIDETPGRFVVMVRSSLPGLMKKLNCTQDAKLIYSMWHGYLEEPGLRKFLALVRQKGIELVQLHFGGHARPDILQSVVRTLKPKCVVPIHTDRPRDYAELLPGVNAQVAEDGKPIDL